MLFLLSTADPCLIKHRGSTITPSCASVPLPASPLCLLCYSHPPHQYNTLMNTKVNLPLTHAPLYKQVCQLGSALRATWAFVSYTDSGAPSPGCPLSRCETRRGTGRVWGTLPSSSPFCTCRTHRLALPPASSPPTLSSALHSSHPDTFLFCGCSAM